MASDDEKNPKKFNPGHNAALPQDQLRERDLAGARPTAPRNIPPPEPSPGVPLGDDTKTPTGEYPVTRNELKRWGNVNDLKQVVAMICVAIGAVFGAYKLVLNDAAAQVDLKQAVLQQKHEDLRREVEDLKASTDASFARLDQQMKEVQIDLREFYKAWRDERRSIRLETPIGGLDGGR